MIHVNILLNVPLCVYTPLTRELPGYRLYRLCSWLRQSPTYHCVWHSSASILLIYTGLGHHPPPSQLTSWSDTIATFKPLQSLICVQTQQTQQTQQTCHPRSVQVTHCSTQLSQLESVSSHPSTRHSISTFKCEDCEKHDLKVHKKCCVSSCVNWHCSLSGPG